ncbi:acetyl-CoA C-acyltransferase [Neolewinella agarilytica]|uniref:acetyl-CoA C-acetyltransferase n=1 Tax=Neolewinella agarilytica TaxID=478744 RepID=A0A1H9DV29_9BACT|nr:acetyl-CoA C-acyltransferase [Neolewinella agarilytica]SEQ16703.1 acetyl-CoA C-acetyltransferase [Neolewinella agarilytica]
MPTPTVYICSAVRTPIGSFGGMFASLTAPQLGAAAIKGALEKAGVSPDQVDEVLMGNVVSANLGQAPARQAALGAGIPNTVPCTTVNKVCSSGMKTVMFGAQSIMLGHNDIVVAGGMESMSNIPYYVPDARWGAKFGDRKLIDGLSKDGLTDAYDQKAMGTCADATATKYSFSRADQDAYAINSYQRAAASTEDGTFANEIVPVTVPQRRGDDLVITEDEEYKKVKFEKIPTLRPAFNKDGTVTAANASTINDGAAALVLVSEAKMKELGLTPIGRIVSFADAAHEPQWFTTAPTLAAPRALERAGLEMKDMDYLEVNEAFAVVPMAFAKELGISGDNMNVLGGGVSLGHPLGTSGARIIVTLLNVLKVKGGKYGLATLCNGGGGASALVVERL